MILLVAFVSFSIYQNANCRGKRKELMEREIGFKYENTKQA